MIQVSFSKLNTKELYTLGMRTKELIDAVITPELGIDLYYNNFKTHFESYSKSMENIKVSAEEVAIADNLRDDMLIALRTHIKNYLYHPNTEIKKAAGNMLEEIDKNGEQIYAKSYEDETAILDNIISVFSHYYSEALQQINADEWFTLLSEAQKNFETVLRNYNAQKADTQELKSATEIRPLLTEALRKLYTFLPLHAEISGSEALQTIVAQLSEEAKRY